MSEKMKVQTQDYPVTYKRTPAMDRQIRKEIGDGIFPVLKPYGFVRKNNHFARIVGVPQFIQTVSVDYRRYYDPMICVDVMPLYNIHAFWESFFRGINLGYEFAPGPTPEDIAGLRLFKDYGLNSYLRGQTNYGDAIEKDKELLADVVMPILESVEDPASYLRALCQLLHRNDVEGSFADNWLLGRYDKIECAVASINPDRFIAFGWNYEHPIIDENGQWNEEATKARLRADCDVFLAAIANRDHKSVLNWMNRSIEYAYENMRKYFATLSKTYEMRLITRIC